MFPLYGWNFSLFSFLSSFRPPSEYVEPKLRNNSVDSSSAYGPLFQLFSLFQGLPGLLCNPNHTSLICNVEPRTSLRNWFSFFFFLLHRTTFFLQRHSEASSNSTLRSTVELRPSLRNWAVLLRHFFSWLEMLVDEMIRIILFSTKFSFSSQSRIDISFSRNLANLLSGNYAQEASNTDTFSLFKGSTKYLTYGLVNPLLKFSFTHRTLVLPLFSDDLNPSKFDRFFYPRTNQPP